jgi:hypothetical protein
MPVVRRSTVATTYDRLKHAAVGVSYSIMEYTIACKLLILLGCIPARCGIMAMQPVFRHNQPSYAVVAMVARLQPV